MAVNLSIGTGWWMAPKQHTSFQRFREIWNQLVPNGDKTFPLVISSLCLTRRFSFSLLDVILLFGEINATIERRDDKL